ncbi:MAG: hypothetical protein ACK4VN_03140 [Bacteroidales bacterium]
MKTIYKIFAIAMVVGLWSCEKNDPLSDQGDLTGKIVPFNLLAQMPDAAAGDTLNLRTVTWAVNDDIESVSFHHMGFKLREYEVKMAIPTQNGPTVELAVVHLEDSVKIAKTLIKSYPEAGQSLNDFYQTIENAYVIVHSFVVPQVYKLNRERNQELIDVMPQAVFQTIVEKFSLLFKRPTMISVFPEINPFSIVYFEIDGNGNYTGNLTAAGREYIQNNLDKERMKDFLKEAVVADNTRVTIESVSSLVNEQGSTSSRRTFRAL